MKKELSNVKAVSGQLKETEEKITEYSVKKDKIQRTIRVREVENGFIVEITEDGYKKSSSKDKYDDGWYYAKQTYISKSNPLDIEISDEDDANMPDLDINSTIKQALNNLKI